MLRTTYYQLVRTVQIVPHSIAFVESITRLQAFENAIVVLMALGGSTNGVLHLLALAQEAEVFAIMCMC